MKQLEGFENIPELGSEEFSLLLPFVLLLFVGTLSEVSLLTQEAIIQRFLNLGLWGQLLL